MTTMFPCAKVKVAEDDDDRRHNNNNPQRWSTPRTVVEAYVRLRRDHAALQNIWLADHDVVRLLDARYDFRGGGARIKLTVKGVNKFFMSIGPMRLGKNFCHHPELNLLGHYRVWRNVKPGDASPAYHAFYFMCSEDRMTAVPVLDEEAAKPKHPFDLDQLLLNSDLRCNSLLNNMKRCTDDEIAFHLVALRAPKQRQQQPSSSSKKRAAPKLCENSAGTEASAASKVPRNESDDGATKNSSANIAAAAAADYNNDNTAIKVRRKPGPKPKPKPPPAPKPCLGWSGFKFNPLIRRSLVQYLDAQPPESDMVIPSKFPLLGPKDFHVLYNPQSSSTNCSSGEHEEAPPPPFVVYANGHDPSNCERAQRSYKHCPVCMKASGRLRTYLYLKGNKNNGNRHNNAESVEEDNDYDSYDANEEGTTTTNHPNAAVAPNAASIIRNRVVIHEEDRMRQERRNASYALLEERLWAHEKPRTTTRYAI